MALQKKLVRKHGLEMVLSRLEPHPSPRARLEQYTIPAEFSGQILRLAAYVYDDIIGKTVFDLGCGTGRLAIGAAILGASDVVGVDIDSLAVRLAMKNAKEAGVEKTTSWIVSDVEVVIGQCDTVVQNPPFGVRRRGADRLFLRRALEAGNVVYSLHKSGKKSRAFIGNYVKKLGGELTEVFPMKFPIPPTFHFHEKRKYMVDVDLYRIKR